VQQLAEPSAQHRFQLAGTAGYSFLLPFTWQTWMMFLITMLVVILLLTGMDIATRKFRHAACAKVDLRKVQRLRKRGAAELLSKRRVVKAYSVQYTIQS
jgi:hypothetical protein